MTDCAWEGPGFTRCARASSFVSRIRPDEYQWAPGTGSVKTDATTNGIAFWAWISKINSSRGISIYPRPGDRQGFPPLAPGKTHTFAGAYGLTRRLTAPDTGRPSAQHRFKDEAACPKLPGQPTAVRFIGMDFCFIVAVGALITAYNPCIAAGSSNASRWL